jgi:glycosyltransferase involved in cell wall biosynthesis
MVMEVRSEQQRSPAIGLTCSIWAGLIGKGDGSPLAVSDRTRQESLPVNWRIVGGRVCGTPGSTDRDLESIMHHVQPPVMTASGLSRHYSWADVVIMVSRFEGVPLTILEAQQHGCVVLSTRVGAIDEIVEDGRTGFLFSNDLDTPALVEKIVGCLSRLQAERGRLMEIARAGAALRRTTTWSVNFQAFAHFVESHLHSRGIKKK